MDPFTRVAIVRVREGRRSPGSDVTATEAPLELRLQGQPLAVIMRTPGADRELAAGFLLAERVVRRADDLGTIEYCLDTTAGGAPAGSVINVTLDPAASDAAGRLLASRRLVMASAACGVCGRETLAALQTGLAPLNTESQVSLAVVSSLPDRLRERQPLFATTGGLHAAGVFGTDGHLMSVAEDVGRHNAVDKAVGSLLLRDALPLRAAVLCVSGRTSYEIVQKAWCAGLAIVVSVSAPSSLAVSLAEQAGITLAGFVRDGGLNIYTNAGRIV
jgi:FdhD protein